MQVSTQEVPVLDSYSLGRGFFPAEFCFTKIELYIALTAAFHVSKRRSGPIEPSWTYNFSECAHYEGIYSSRIETLVSTSV